MKMRYLFRGKRIDNGDWVQGYLIYAKKDCYVCENPYECMSEYSSLNGQSYGFGGFKLVDTSTICQCTGLKDKNGKLIWENDICRRILLPTKRIKTNFRISYVPYKCCLSAIDLDGSNITFLSDYINNQYEVEVIGNIFDEGSENIGKGAEEN